MPAARAIAGAARLVSRRAAAAGPMRRAVERMAPMVMAERETATARAIRYPSPTSRTGTPRVAARSGLRGLSSRGRYEYRTVPVATTLKTAITGTSDDERVKMEPKSTLTVAPVVLEDVVSQYRNSAASPR